MSNISIAGNYIGFGNSGAIYPNSPSSVTYSDNVVFDWRNSDYSTTALAAYKASGIMSRYPSIATIYGSPNYNLFATPGVATNFVGGFSNQRMYSSTGASIFTELAISDSSTMMTSSPDALGGFDPGKDVIDLSRIDANMSVAGVQNFAYIGNAPFSGTGAQVRSYTSGGQTYVQAKLAGETSADLALFLPHAALTLTGANFALTANASSAALAAAAALKVSTTAISGGAREYSYSNVVGKNYSSYQSVVANGNLAAESFNMSATSGQISVIQPGVTITRGSAAESLQAGGGTFALAFHANEAINIGSGASSTVINLGTKFGAETITGFDATSAAPDTLQLSTAAFSYLNAGMNSGSGLIGRSRALGVDLIGSHHQRYLRRQGDAVWIDFSDPCRVFVDPLHLTQAGARPSAPRLTQQKRKQNFPLTLMDS